MRRHPHPGSARRRAAGACHRALLQRPESVRRRRAGRRVPRVPVRPVGPRTLCGAPDPDRLRAAGGAPRRGRRRRAAGSGESQRRPGPARSTARPALRLRGRLPQRRRRSRPDPHARSCCRVCRCCGYACIRCGTTAATCGPSWRWSWTWAGGGRCSCSTTIGSPSAAGRRRRHRPGARQPPCSLPACGSCRGSTPWPTCWSPVT